MRRILWALLLIAGLAIMLPLGWLSYTLIVFIPGFAILSLAKRELTISELIGISTTLSILLLPVAVLLSSLESINYAGILLGSIVAVTGLYHLARGSRLQVNLHDWPILAIALPVFIIVLLVMMKTFVLGDNGLVCATTHSSDLNFHLSIAQRFIVSPSVPPEDPYLPGYPIVYNWFMHVAMGSITLLTGVGLFESFKVLVALVAALILVDACLLARIAFGSFKASLVAGLVYIASSGLSWIYILYTWMQGREVDMFKSVIYEWSGIMKLKYDTPSLYFFLPQTQTFGLLALICGIYLYILSIKERSAIMALITGLVLGSLVLYHTITAFPLLIALGLSFLYLVYRERGRIFHRDGFGLLAIAALPLVISAIAAIYQLTILSASAGQQIIPGYQGNVPQTILMSLGPLVPFALYGIYRARDKLTAVPLIIFAGVNLLFLNILQMPATWNTYRFLVYLGLPVSLFAGLALSGWLFSGKHWKIVLALLVILAMLPSTVAIVMFFSDSSYVHATPADVKALEWVKENTPANAIFYEEPTHFVRLPVITGRDVTYAGNVYTWQYHNVDKQPELESIVHMADRDELYKALTRNHADYVFIGSKEAGYPFAVALEGMPQVKAVYDRDGVKVYKVGLP